jgi:ubiquinone/menaquinone biosynthesis C-methylase UbiE
VALDRKAEARNYFDSRGAARRYSAARPYFHPLVIGKIKDFMGLTETVPLALDVACGTGQSSVALKEIAEQVVGVDPSETMLAMASHDDRIRYVEASAEELPFPEAEFDLVTVSLAFHWFDRDPFLAEASRVLRPFGWLVIYDNHFQRRMKENPGYERWIEEVYAASYPTPSRNSDTLTDQDARMHGFALVGREEYSNEFSFTLEELVSYLMSQSNINAAIEEGRETEETVRRWLTEAQSPFFEEPRRTFLFGGTIDYLRRDA